MNRWPPPRLLQLPERYDRWEGFVVVVVVVYFNSEWTPSHFCKKNHNIVKCWECPSIFSIRKICNFFHEAKKNVIASGLSCFYRKISWGKIFDKKNCNVRNSVKVFVPEVIHYIRLASRLTLLPRKASVPCRNLWRQIQDGRRVKSVKS